MNPMLAEALGSIVRAGLMVLAGFVVKAGIWDAGQAEVYAAAGALAVVGLGWSLWQKYKSRVKLLSALSMTDTTSEANLEVRIAAGATPTVSVSTPKTTQA